MTEDREHRERREERENEEGGTKRIKVTDKRRVRTDARPEERPLDPRGPVISTGADHPAAGMRGQESEKR